MRVYLLSRALKSRSQRGRLFSGPRSNAYEFLALGQGSTFEEVAQQLGIAWSGLNPEPSKGRTPGEPFVLRIEAQDRASVLHKGTEARPDFFGAAHEDVRVLLQSIDGQGRIDDLRLDVGWRSARFI